MLRMYHASFFGSGARPKGTDLYWDSQLVLVVTMGCADPGSNILCHIDVKTI
jgi:hypothetical protein